MKRAMVMTMHVQASAVGKREGSVRHLLDLAAPAYRLAVYVLDSPDAADDVVQQSYLEALDKIRPGSARESERTWFLTLVANRARDYKRRERSRKKREASVNMRGRVYGTGSEPGNAMIAALRGALSALDAKYRLPLLLCYQEDMSHSEVAAVLRMPRTTVSKYVNVGLAKLRKALERAGYVMLPTVVIGSLKQTAPAVPASLVGKVEALVAQSAMKTGAAASASAAAKGGLAMKLIAGIVLAASVAAGVAVVSGTGSRLPAEKIPGKDYPYGEGVIYKRDWLFGNRSYGYQDGPACEIETGAGNENSYALAPSGNWYVVDGCVTRTIRKYDAKKKRVITIAWAGPWGGQGGPAETIRLGGSDYNGGVGVSWVDPSESFLLLVDTYNDKAVWRFDLKTGVVNRLPASGVAKGAGVVARAPDGSLYCGLRNGQLKKILLDGTVQDMKTVLETPVSSQGAFVDSKHTRLYSMRREPGMPWGVVWYWDLKTGKGHHVAGPRKGEKPDPKLKQASGPADKVSFWCPGGFTMGPDKGQRYVYLGGGDESTFSRIDTQKNYVHKLKRAGPKDGNLWTIGEGDKRIDIGIPWPGAPIWGRSGEFHMLFRGKGVLVYRPVGSKQ